MKIAMLGFGNIGAGFYKEISSNYKDIEIVRALVRDIKKTRQIGSDKLTLDYERILNDPEITAVVDVTAGQASVKLIIDALNASKSVVTANKMAVALAGGEFLDIARAKGVNFYFEAAVGGGMPVIDLFNESVRPHRIDKVIGILNGTTNYILTKMSCDGLDFVQALKLAQDKGFAEPDPSFDLSGRDSAYKITILKDLLFDYKCGAEDIFCQGIDKISKIDLDYAASIDYRIKLTGYINNFSSGIDIGVRPIFLPASHPLAQVNNEYNAIYIEGSPMGEIMLYGRGAGAGPTASSLIGDLLRIKRDGPRGFNRAYARNADKKSAMPPEMKSQSNYFRFNVLDVPGVISKITTIFEKYNISISSMKQDISNSNEPAAVIFTTHESKSSKIPSMIEEIKRNKFIINEPVWYKIGI